MALTGYSTISPRTSAFVVKELLTRGVPYLTLEQFAQSKPLPAHSTKSLSFRRYNALDATVKYLTEGVKPASTQLTKTDVTLDLYQLGDLVEISDVVADTHEDPVLTETYDILGEQGALMVEKLRWGKLILGSSVAYANGSVRTAVNTAVSLNLQRKVTRALKRQYAGKITKRVASTPNYKTESVAPSFVAICHTDLENDIRALSGFKPVENYGSVSPYEGEIGSVDDVRYIMTPVSPIWADGGGTKGTMLSTTGTLADVYPILYMGKDAYAISAFKGAYAIKPMVRQPNAPDSADPLGQTGSVGWKGFHGACILNDAWMVRAEVACSAL